MIRSIVGIGSRGGGAEIVNKRFTRYMQPIINPSHDAGALDSSQAWLLDVLETDTEWRVFYNGANTQLLHYEPDNQDYINNDATYLAIKTKSNDVRTGWEKVRDVNGDPKPIFKPSFVDGRFDEWQAWIRTVIYEDGVLKAWFIGDSGFNDFVYKVGYATSNDLGETWTKYGTTPIYTDLLTGGGRGIVVLRVVHDDTNYKMIYAGLDPNVSGMFIAESSDGITGWTKTHSNLFANQELGFPCDFRYVDGFYYLWTQRYQQMPAGNLGPCREVILYRSANLTDWEFLGVQMKIRGSQEFGIGNHVKALQKPNGEWFMLHTFYIQRTQAFEALNNTKEPSIGTKVAESNSTDSFIMNSECDFSYPDNVTFHAPLGFDMGLTEVISGQSGSVNTKPLLYAFERDFLKLSGSQTLTFANNGALNGDAFAIKMRVEIKTTGTHELFRIGNDVLITLESGKLRVRLSSNGSGYEKDYITSVNISKPVGMDYIDNHIYIGVLWSGGTLRLFNDFVEFTSGQITKTVDNALTTVNESGSNILIGQNAAIELRSVSVGSDFTATDLIELDI